MNESLTIISRVPKTALPDHQVFAILCETFCKEIVTDSGWSASLSAALSLISF
jgi:hypothetical protein